MTHYAYKATPLPHHCRPDLFDPLPADVVIEIDVAPSGDLADIPLLLVGNTATLDVSSAFISRDSAGAERTIIYTATSDDNTIATVSLTGGVGTITGVAMGTTDINIVADDGTGMFTRIISVTVEMGVCNRTDEVETAILAAISPSPACDAVTVAELAAITILDLSTGIAASTLLSHDFAGLSALATLNLSSNSLTTLPSGVFSALTSLTSLDLSSNSLTTLSADLFADLTSLATLRLQGNTFTTALPANLFDPLPDSAVIEIDVAPIGDLADIPSLTVDGTTTINIANAFISKDNAGTDRTLSFTTSFTGTSVTTATVDTAVLSITASTITGTANITITADDDGGTDTRADATQTIAVTVETGMDICARTTEVRTRILAAIPETSDCTAVTAVQLAAITSLNINFTSISSLQSGDFSGLSGLITLDLRNNTSLTTLPADLFSGLTSLERLNLAGNRGLTTLPAGLFTGLTSLTLLNLNSSRDFITGTGGIPSLPAGLFAGLTSLTTLNLSSNDLSTLPAGLFNPLTNLEILSLARNRITTLDVNVFSALTNLQVLDLGDNALSALPAGLFSGLTSLASLRLQDNTFTTALPADLFDPLGSAVIDIDVAPIGDPVADITLSAGDETSIDVSGAFISRNQFGVDRTISFSATSANPAVATVSLTTGGTGTITAGSTTGTTTDVTITARSLTSDILVSSMSTRDIAVTVEGVVDICDRTAEVQTAILAAIPSPAPACGNVLASQLFAIASLDLSGMSISTLLTGDFTDLVRLTSLNLSSNALSGISALPADVFDPLTRLTRLELASSSINALNPNVFSTLTSLTSLDLSGNSSLSTLPDDVFSTLTSLTTLNLSSNDLSTLPAGLFNPLTNLEILSLARNGITTLDVNVFSALTNLQVLDLGDNALSALPAGLFSGLTSLASLRLQDNTFTTALPADLFDPLPTDALIEIDLSPIGDLVTDVALATGAETPLDVSGAFISRDSAGAERTITYTATSANPAVATVSLTGGVGTITGVAMGTTNINIVADDDGGGANADFTRTIAVTVEAGMSICDRTAEVEAAILAAIPITNDCTAVTSTQLAAITILVLDGTPDTPSLSSGDFTGLSGLTALGIFSNTLSALPAGVFDNLTSLTFLSLTNNMLTTLPAGLFSGLTSLATLRLQGNAFTALPADVFDNLRSLTELDLAGNVISALEADVFSSLTALASLNLVGNQLTALPAGLFSGLTSLATLRLQGNTFTTALPADIFGPLPGTAVIEIDLSPIGDLADIPSLTVSGTTTVTISNAFISRDTDGNERTISFTATPANTAIATASENNGVVTIEGVAEGTTDVTITAADGVGTATQTISVTVVEVGIVAYDATTAGSEITSVTIANENSGTMMFYVELQSAPVGNVVMSVMSSNTNEGTVSPNTLTFTTANWNSRQAITVTAVDDNVDSDSDDSFDVDFVITSGDGGNYATTTTLSSVTVTITDDDTASTTINLSVSPSSIPETADAITITVTATLGSAVVLITPTDVTVTVGDVSDSATEGTDYTTVGDFTLTIPALSSSGTQTFMIDPDTSSTNGDMVTINGEATINGMIATVNSATLTIVEAGILAFEALTGGTSIDAITIAEASGTGMFYVQLASQPATGSSVVIGVASSDINEGTVTPATLTFTDTTWDARQALTVTAVPDNIDDDDTFTVDFVVMSGDSGNYTNSLDLPSVAVTVTDDDTLSDTINLSISPPSIAETADATTITVTATIDGTVVLPTPTVVTVSVGGGTATSGTDYATVSNFDLTIPALSLSATGTFMIDPTDDTTDDNNEVVTISGTAPGFTTVNTADLTIVEAGISVHDAMTLGNQINTATIDENNGTGTLYVQLASQPATGSSVVIGVASSDINEGTVDMATLTFTDTTWDARQALTVTAVDDNIDDDDTFTVDFVVMSGDSGNYTNSLDLPSVAVTVNR